MIKMTLGGASGVVYLAEDHVLERRVALKELKLELQGDRADRAAPPGAAPRVRA